MDALLGFLVDVLFVVALLVLLAVLVAGGVFVLISCINAIRDELEEWRDGF